MKILFIMGTLLATGCGEAPSTLKVIGGEPLARPGFFLSLKKNDQVFCGAVYLGDGFAMSAAHCVHDLETDLYVSTQDLEDSGEQDQRVHRVLVPKGFDEVRSPEADVALLDLGRSFREPASWRALSLATEALKPGSQVTVMGRGQLSNVGYVVRDELRQAELTVQDPKSCGVNPSYSFCAAATGPVMQDSCRGDSGGPVLSQGALVGVVSRGTCARGPGIYTAVAGFSKWLTKTMALVKTKRLPPLEAWLSQCYQLQKPLFYLHEKGPARLLNVYKIRRHEITPVSQLPAGGKLASPCGSFELRVGAQGGLFGGLRKGPYYRLSPMPETISLPLGNGTLHAHMQLSRSKNRDHYQAQLVYQSGKDHTLYTPLTQEGEAPLFKESLFQKVGPVTSFTRFSKDFQAIQLSLRLGEHLFVNDVFAPFSPGSPREPSYFRFVAVQDSGVTAEILSPKTDMFTWELRCNEPFWLQLAGQDLLHPSVYTEQGYAHLHDHRLEPSGHLAKGQRLELLLSPRSPRFINLYCSLNGLPAQSLTRTFPER